MSITIRITGSLLCIVLLSSFAYADNHGIVGREGNRFVLNGQPYYYAGSNNYYQMVFAADPGLRYAIDEVQEEMVAMGMTVLRTWAFNDGEDQWNALQIRPRVYQEYVFQGLDYVLDKANQVGLRVILPFVNNWDDYGGMNQYVAWSPTANSHDDFYTDDSCRAWYRNHIATVLNRVNTFNGRLYKEDATVFAWELANEPRCSSDPSGNTLQVWTEEMSAYIKSLDSLHMVTTGSEGFYGPTGPPHNPVGWFGTQGVDFIRNHQVATIDFAVFHAWPDWWGIGYNTAIAWVVDHIDDADTILQKPVVLEEYGKQRPTDIRDQFFQGWLDAIFAGAQAGKAAAGSNLWILYHDDYPDHDGFGVYYPRDTSTVAILQAHAEAMNELTEPTPEQEIELYPVDPPVTVPRGGHFFYHAKIINHADTSVNLDCWVGVTLPNGTPFGPLKLYEDLTFPASDSVTFSNLRQHVRQAAPLGDYQYIGYIGDYPTVYDSSYFPFTVTADVVDGKDSRSLEGWGGMGRLPSFTEVVGNRPNPFNATTTINYQLAADVYVKLEVYNLLGQEVATLVDEKQQAGYRSIIWNASGVSSGLYFYKLTGGDYRETKRMMLLK